MRIRNFGHLFFASLVMVFFVLVSCQKEIDIDLENPPPVPGEVTDSTLLIKSITLVWDVGSSDEDSATEYYSYDTVNRKITIRWEDENENFIANGTQAAFIYNVKGLLTRAEYMYPTGYVPWSFDYNTIDLAYDESNVLQKVTTKYSNGEIEVHLFNKIVHPGGSYQLTWNSYGINPDDTAFRKVKFDKNGNAITSYGEYYYYPSPGDPNRELNVIFDSLAYGASGDVEKIFRQVDYPGADYDANYILYEFTTRQTKGDQLYNHRQILLNGIANIPFGDLDIVATDGFGLLSILMDYENLQYSNCPAQTIKARMWDGTFKNFTGLSEYDSKDRLTKFTGFFHDYDLEPMEYSIEYYK